MDLSEKISELRKANGLSQEQLAEKIGVSSNLCQNGNVANHCLS